MPVKGHSKCFQFAVMSITLVHIVNSDSKMKVKKVLLPLNVLIYLLTSFLLSVRGRVGSVLKFLKPFDIKPNVRPSRYTGVSPLGVTHVGQRN